MPRSALKLLVIALLSVFTSSILCAQSSFDTLVVFGDSLLDTGNYGNGFRFTNETSPGSGVYRPTSIDLLAQELRVELQPAIEGGSNYAVGGHRVVDILNAVNGSGIDTRVVASGGMAPAFLDRVEGRVSAGTLIAIDGGGNDIRDIVVANIASPANIPDAVLAAASTYIESIRALAQAGADHIMVFNAPDLGRTPGVELFDKVLLPGLGAAEGFSQTSHGYNAAVETLAVLELPEVNIIPVDLEAFSSYLFANAERYGYASGALDIGGGIVVEQFSTCYNSSGGDCVEHPVYGISGMAPNPRVLFHNDSLHPTELTGELFADYLSDILAAPKKVGLLPEIALSAGRSQLTATSNELRHSRWRVDNNAGRLFVSGDIATAEYDQPFAPEADQQSVIIGRSFVASEQLVYGVSLTLMQQELDVEGVAFEADAWGISGLLGYRRDSWFIDASAGLMALSYDDLQRDFSFGSETLTAEGSTDGHVWSVDVLAAYQWLQDEDWHIAPAIGLSYLNSTVDGYREQGGEISNYEWGEQKRKSLEWRLGAVSGFDLGAVSLFAEIFAVQEQEDEDQSIRVRNTNLNFSAYRLPSFHAEDDSFIRLNAGATLTVGEGELQFSLHVSDRGDGEQQLTLNYALPL